MSRRSEKNTLPAVVSATAQARFLGPRCRDRPCSSARREARNQTPMRIVALVKHALASSVSFGVDRRPPISVVLVWASVKGHATPIASWEHARAYLAVVRSSRTRICNKSGGSRFREAAAGPPNDDSSGPIAARFRLPGTSWLLMAASPRSQPPNSAARHGPGGSKVAACGNVSGPVGQTRDRSTRRPAAPSFHGFPAERALSRFDWLAATTNAPSRSRRGAICPPRPGFRPR